MYKTQSLSGQTLAVARSRTLLPLLPLLFPAYSSCRRRRRLRSCCRRITAPNPCRIGEKSMAGPSLCLVSSHPPPLPHAAASTGSRRRRPRFSSAPGREDAARGGNSSSRGSRRRRSVIFRRRRGGVDASQGGVSARHRCAVSGSAASASTPTSFAIPLTYEATGTGDHGRILARRQGELPLRSSSLSLYTHVYARFL